MEWLNVHGYRSIYISNASSPPGNLPKGVATAELSPGLPVQSLPFSKMKLEKFWEDLGQLLKKFENVRRVFLLADMNMRVGSTEIWGVVGKYGVEGVNKNGQYLVNICAERGQFLSNTFSQHKMIHSYTCARGNERRLIDYTAVDNMLRREVEDAKAVREVFSD